MNKEQVDALKVGDKFIMVCEVLPHYPSADDEDKKQFPIRATLGKTTWHATYADMESADVVSTIKQEGDLVTPSPTIEVGDTVRVIPDPLTGTIYGNAMIKDEFAGHESVVVKIVNDYGDVGVKEHSGILLFNIHCLELVKKAVKDKYTIVDAHFEWRVCENWGDLMTVSAFTKVHHPNAKAAAEAECARLNAEWRKQQEGGAE